MAVGEKNKTPRPNLKFGVEKKIKTPFLKCAVGEKFQHHAREARDFFKGFALENSALIEAREKIQGFPLENSVFSQFCARSAWKF